MTRLQRTLSAAVAALALYASQVSSAEPDAGPPSLKCETGPLHKSFGGSDWLVYACDDSRSAVAVSAPGSPAMPFYFMLYVDPSKHLKLYGEGTGAKSATDPAYAELQKLTVEDVAALVAEAKASR